MGLNHIDYLRYNKLLADSYRLERQLKDLNRSMDILDRKNNELKEKINSLSQYSNIDEEQGIKILNNLSEDENCVEFCEIKYDNNNLSVREFKKTLSESEKNNFKYIQSDLEFYTPQIKETGLRFKTLGFDYRDSIAYEELKRRIIEDHPNDKIESEILIDNFTKFIL